LVENIIRKHGYSDRISANTSIYLAATLEYLAAEILELSGNEARDRLVTKSIPKITPLDIKPAVSNDEELNLVFDGVLNG
jgi:histone H2A